MVGLRGTHGAGEDAEGAALVLFVEPAEHHHLVPAPQALVPAVHRPVPVLPFGGST